MDLYLIRGLPGSGKSTLAKILAEALGFIHLEADKYFETPDGYIFDASQLKEAHQWCYDSCAFFVSTNRGVIVSNTFTTEDELKPYINLAKKHGVKYTIIDMHNNFGSIHNVQDKNIQRMIMRWQDTRDIVGYPVGSYAGHNTYAHMEIPNER